MILPGVLERIDPAGTPLPLVFDLPHSGREYPHDFGSSLPLSVLRRGEDAYVEELLDGSAARGVTVLRALFPRTYIDPNRDEADIDTTLVDGRWPCALRPGPKTKLGIGLIRRVVVPGAAIYDRKLRIDEIRHRIDHYYRPYRDALSALLGQSLQQHGYVLHIDWHSMKSVGNRSTPDGDGTRRTDFVLGDLNGEACDPQFTLEVADCLRELGHSVALNDPYSGGDILRTYGRPALGVHSLQIEINRCIYMDEDHVEKTPGFPRIREHLTGVLLERLVDFARTRSMP